MRAILGQPARYVITGDRLQVLEVQKFYAKPASYFIDDHVKEGATTAPTSIYIDH